MIICEDKEVELNARTLNDMNRWTGVGIIYDRVVVNVTSAATL